MYETPTWTKWTLGIFGGIILLMVSAAISAMGDMKEVKGQNVATQLQISTMQIQVTAMQGQIVTLYDRLAAERYRPPLR